MIRNLTKERVTRGIKRLLGQKVPPPPPPFEVGRFTYGWEGIRVADWGDGSVLKIGNYCSISGLTVSLGGNHRHDYATTFPFGYKFVEELGGTDIGLVGFPKRDVIIGNDVWIGMGVTVMSGVTVGHGAVIAANSHVVKDVAPYQIVGGNPAKLIRPRFAPGVIDLLLQLSWWDLPVEDVKAIAPRLCQVPNEEVLRGLIRQYRSGT